MLGKQSGNRTERHNNKLAHLNKKARKNSLNPVSPERTSANPERIDVKITFETNNSEISEIEIATPKT